MPTLAPLFYTCQTDGMATMTYRTTFALDAATMQRIKNLASLWKVSQAEVVRRAVCGAQTPVSTAPPHAVLQSFLQAGNGLEADAATQYLKEVREHRNEWRGR